MKYLLDTCVISEVIKPKANRQVLAWLKKQEEENLYLSVLTFGEIEKGIERSADGRRRNKLRMWVGEDLKQRFEGRILPINMQVASRWGEVRGKSEVAGKPLPAIDAANSCYRPGE